MNRTAPIPFRAAVRWGNLAVYGGLALAILLVGGITALTPHLLPWLAVALLALACGVLLFSHPRLNFVVWLGGLALLLSSQPGFQWHELVYGLYFYAYLVYWYGQRLLFYKRPLLHGKIDLAVALWLTMGLTLGISLGLLFGADPIHIRGEAIALTMVALYFPVKEFCTREKHGPTIILGIVTWLGVFVTLDNAISAKDTFATASYLWQISDVRTSGRELLLTFSGVLLVAVLPVIRNRTTAILVAICLSVIIAGLILTKSRTFWVAFPVAVAFLILLSPAKERARLIAWFAAGGAVLVLFGITFLIQYKELLLAGISNRFITMNSITADLSFVNRFFESKAVLEHIKLNPILGYGLGTTYSFFDIIAQRTITRSYVHIGFLAVLFKFGIWGSCLIAVLWFGSLYTSFSASRLFTLPNLHRAMLRGIVACLICMSLPAFTSSVFFEDEKIAAFILVAALGMGLAGRPSTHRREMHENK